MYSVPSGPRDLYCCPAGFVTFHQEFGENPPPKGGNETCSGITPTNSLWILVSVTFNNSKGLMVTCVAVILDFNTINSPISVKCLYTFDHNQFIMSLVSHTVCDSMFQYLEQIREMCGKCTSCLSSMSGRSAGGKKTVVIV